jgi:hypothetical protein
MSRLRSSFRWLRGLRTPRSDTQSPQAEHSAQLDLCERCGLLPFENAFLDHRLSEEEQADFGTFAFNAVGKSTKCQIATGTVRDLQDASHCSFCQILAAVHEQYSTEGNIPDPTGAYQLRWRYVPHNFNRRQSGGNLYTAYIEILSSANSDLRDGLFHFKIESKREFIRSIIAPVNISSSEKRLWTRELPDRVDKLQLRKWIRSCRKSHKDCCTDLSSEQAAQLLSSSFRVIDVKAMCIVTPIMPCRYVALSYVWGSNGENSFVAVNENISRLMQPRGLDCVLHLLPATILDAITITTELGERYLWIDSLCIVQDDTENKEKNIESMPIVYNGSTLTLVAGIGNSATSGLSGVRAGSRSRSQRILNLGSGKKLALIDDMELLMTKSPWQTRGWTYVMSWNPLVVAELTLYLDSKNGFCHLSASFFSAARPYFLAAKELGGKTSPQNASHNFCNLVSCLLTMWTSAT